MFSALLAFCEGKPMVTDGLSSQRARNVGCVSGFLWGETIDHRWIPSQRAWNAGFDVCLNSRLNKQSSCVTSDLKSCDVNVIIPPASTKYTGITLSVCGQNRVRSVSSTILIGSISYLHILSSNFRRCVTCNARFKIKKLEILANFLNL